MARLIGRTRQQISDAPRNAVYVWVNWVTEYPERLARDLNRRDLAFVSPQWLEAERWRGRLLTGLVVDHAVELSPIQVQSLHEALARVDTDPWNPAA